VIAFGQDDRAAAVLPDWAVDECGDLAALTCRRTAGSERTLAVSPPTSECVTLPGHYWLDEVVECTPLRYALRQNESHSEGGTIAFLRERGAIE
jgi:hypothetical protein